MIGYYYLHTNGNLIYKPKIVVDSDPSYFDSPFVKKVWRFDPEDRFDAWKICVEALVLGANKSRIMELKAKWGLDDEDAQHFVDRAELALEKDGTDWCVHDKEEDGFTNIQECQSGHGNTALEALADFAKQGSLVVKDKS